ncbi:hypothetical protein WEI85_07955 [Actinomycetes bacterium KLBMP 9797]
MTGGDNLRPGPARPFGVTPDDLENALRDSLSGAAADAYPIRNNDLAGTAIRRARRTQRRWSVAGVALVAAATVVAGAGVTQIVPAQQRQAGPAWVFDPAPELERPDEATPSPSPALPDGPELRQQQLELSQRPLVDVVVAGNLRTASGRVVSIDGLGTVRQAHEVDGGWLVVSGQPSDGFALWYVGQFGARRQLLPPAKAMVLGSDGRQVAWIDGARLFAGAVVQGEIAGAKQAIAPREGLPISFVGAAVLMGRAQGGDLDGYAVWWPERGGFEPAWNDAAVSVYGSMPDGHTVVGQVRDESTPACLALLDANNALSVLKTACALSLADGGAGSVSPDGRWLVADASFGAAAVVDLSSAFTTKPAPARPAGPPLRGSTVWADPNTLVHAVDNALFRVRVDRIAAGKAGVDSVPVSGAAPDSVLVLISKRLA